MGFCHQIASPGPISIFAEYSWRYSDLKVSEQHKMRNRLKGVYFKFIFIMLYLIKVCISGRVFLRIVLLGTEAALIFFAIDSLVYLTYRITYSMV